MLLPLSISLLLNLCLANNLMIGVRESKYDETSPSKFEQFVNLNFSTNVLYVPFQFKHTDYDCMKTALPTILKQGRMPLLIWDMSNSKSVNSVFENLDKGGEDAYIDGFADVILKSLVRDSVIYVALGNDINTEDSYWRKNPELYMRCVDYVAKKLRLRTTLARAARATDHTPTYEFVLPVSATYKVLPSTFVPNATAYNYSLITVTNFAEPKWSEAMDLMIKVDNMLQESEDILNAKIFLIAGTVSKDDTTKKADWISNLVDEVLIRCAWIPVLILDNVETGKDTGYFFSVNGDTIVGQNSNGQDLYSYCRLPDILSRDGIVSWVPKESGDPEDPDNPDDPPVNPPVDPPVDPDYCKAGEQMNSKGECEPCPAGSSSEAGSKCMPCSPGTYQPKPGAGNCIRCPAGQYQGSEGMKFCVDCPKGSYQGFPGKKSCSLCAHGQYQPNQGQIACIRCPGETTTNATGATSRTDCACAGTVGFNETSGRCEICPEGQYKPKLSNICTDCPIPNCECEKGESFNTLTGECEKNTSSGFVRTSAAIFIATLGAVCTVAMLI